MASLSRARRRRATGFRAAHREGTASDTRHDAFLTVVRGARPLFVRLRTQSWNNVPEGDHANWIALLAPAEIVRKKKAGTPPSGLTETLCDHGSGFAIPHTVVRGPTVKLPGWLSVRPHRRARSRRRCIRVASGCVYDRDRYRAPPPMLPILPAVRKVASEGGRPRTGKVHSTSKYRDVVREMAPVAEKLDEAFWPARPWWARGENVPTWCGGKDPEMRIPPDGATAARCVRRKASTRRPPSVTTRGHRAEQWPMITASGKVLIAGGVPARRSKPRSCVDASAPAAPRARYTDAAVEWPARRSTGQDITGAGSSPSQYAQRRRDIVPGGELDGLALSVEGAAQRCWSSVCR